MFLSFYDFVYFFCSLNENHCGKYVVSLKNQVCLIIISFHNNFTSVVDQTTRASMYFLKFCFLNMSKHYIIYIQCFLDYPVVLDTGFREYDQIIGNDRMIKVSHFLPFNVFWAL